MNDWLLYLLNLVNETLTAAIVVVAASMLLYNLTRNLRNDVARTSGIVLACVTAVYIGDVLISLGPGIETYEAILRLQWIGIAFIPAALFHLSDALLATTGLPSRGRRKRVIRFLYGLSTVFLLLALFTNDLIKPIPYVRQVSLDASPWFIVYVAYFITATAIAFINVQRARNRCLTRDTRRRMGYLQIAMLTPVLGIFPFSLLLGPAEQFSIAGLLLVNVANFIVILMLLFLAYPLSFFGSRIPDRMVKAELLRFILRGPGTALLALVAILFITPATAVLGLPGQSFLPFAVVAVILLWQWTVALALPWLEKRLIYVAEDDDHLAKLQTLSEHLLTRTDLLQLLDAILASTCDYLRVNTAFVASLGNGEPELVAAIGPARPTPDWLKEEAGSLHQLLTEDGLMEPLALRKWHSHWIIALYSRRHSDVGRQGGLIGFMGIQARSTEIDLTSDERSMLNTWVRRAAQTLDDVRLQSEVYAALEGLLPQFAFTRSRAAEVEYRPGRKLLPASNGIVDREQFVEQVRAALRHYWGGPGLTSSRLLELHTVQTALANNDDNPVRALRAVLLKAIEKQRPDGERKYMNPEWTIYNILQMRFIERHKVLNVAERLALSEADLYRKQRVAIESVADTLIEMEQGPDESEPQSD